MHVVLMELAKCEEHKQIQGARSYYRRSLFHGYF